MLTPEQKIAEHPLLLQRIASLEARVSWFKKQVFGEGKSEKLDPAQRQLALGMDEARKAIVERTEKITYERTKARAPRPTTAEGVCSSADPGNNQDHPGAGATGSRPVQAHRREAHLESGSGSGSFGKVRERPAEVAPPPGSAAATLPALMPPRVVPEVYASAGLIASIVVGKYVNHLPLARQEQMSSRRGDATISRQTMCDWVEVAAM